MDEELGPCVILMIAATIKNATRIQLAAFPTGLNSEQRFIAS